MIVYTETGTMLTYQITGEVAEKTMHTGLIDAFGHTVEFLHLSVTQRCGLRCCCCLSGDCRDFSGPSMLQQTGSSEADPQVAARHAITPKPERREFLEEPRQAVRFMARTGG